MSKTYTVAALYKFVSLPHFEDLREQIFNFLNEQKVKGTILLAHEGINGTIAGPDEGIQKSLDYLKSLEEFSDLDYKLSYSEDMPFFRLKVRLKKEIVTIGKNEVDPNETVGTYIDPSDWNDIISDPEVVVIDTRNDYEVEIGTFKNAINPNTSNFRQFPEFVKETLDPEKHKKVAMFCTGGIRCEKASSYMKQQGFEEVYHLKGGILKYLENISKDQSLWEGDCFVFDQRVAVTHNLEESEYVSCFGCRRPLSKEDRLSPDYQKGISCPYCIDDLTDDTYKRRFDRQKQMKLAKERNHAHIGPQEETQIQHKNRS